MALRDILMHVSMTRGLPVHNFGGSQGKGEKALVAVLNHVADEGQRAFSSSNELTTTKSNGLWQLGLNYWKGGRWQVAVIFTGPPKKKEDASGVFDLIDLALE